MIKKIFLNFLLALLFADGAIAQTKVIKGTITDSVTHAPLIGASITVPGSEIGTASDKSGYFLLQVPEATKAIEISNLGYTPQMIDASSNLPLQISLSATAKGLNEVVVIGYGTQKKKDLTGAVSTIGAQDIGGRQTLQVSQALQGSIAGVSVTRSSGAPGAGANILIRGITTIGTNDPLVIVDGVPVSSIDNVNPNDVESLTVLKDAASAAIYGSRGAAGVILITTKRAKSGQSSLEYNFEYGAQKPTELPKYVGVQDYMRYFDEQSTNDGASAGPYPQDYINSYLDSNRVHPDVFPNTDWQKAVMTNKTAPVYRHDLVFTAGTGKLKTKASFGYQKSGAFYDNRDYERYLFRVNNDFRINNKLSANLDVAYKRTMNNGNSGELSGSFNPIYEGRIIPPIYDDYYSNGIIAMGKDGRNPIAQINEGGFDKSVSNQILGRLAINFKPVKDLTLTGLMSPTFDLNKTKYFSKQIMFTNSNGITSTVVNQAKTTLDEGRTEGLAINGQFLANYGKQIGNHNIDVLAGYEENYRSFEAMGASRAGFPLTDFPYLNSGSTELRDNYGYANESGLHSFFGRFQYNFNEKYFIQGNLRDDESSRFTSKFRNAAFPSVSGGWIISQENFMKNINWLSFLKIRGSWGEAGNERLLDVKGNAAYYPYQATLAFTNSLFYQNGVVVPLTGAGQQVYAVENITWETSRTTDVGLDAAFLNNKLNVTADYYEKRTSDILLPLDIPLYMGYDKPNQNAGTLNVKGWELELSWKDNIGELNYSIAANLSDAKSKIGDLKGTEFLGDQIIQQGSEYNEWYGYLSDGLFQTANEVANSPIISANTKPGDVKYLDVSGPEGKPDGKITPDDKVLLGGALPRYIYGGNIHADYNNFDLGIGFQGVGKKLTRLPSEATQPFAEAFGNVPAEMVGKFWSLINSPEQNQKATYPRLSRTSNANNYALSNFWLTSGAYFRLKNITLGYTIKPEFIKRAGIQNVRIYVAANDLFSISKYPKYLDPEVSNYSYPIVTTLMAGASIRF